MAFNAKEYLDAVHSGRYDQPEVPAPAAPTPKSGLIRRAVGDTAVAALRGVEGVAETALGVSNIFTRGLVGKGTDAIGLTGKDGYIPRFKEITEGWYSPEAQAARQEVNNAEGFWDTAGKLITSPSAIQTMGVETAPTMYLGGAVAKGLQAVSKLAAPAATAIGEGAVTAGAMAENVRAQDPNNIAGMYASVPAGVVTGLISRGATKLGLGDVETAIATKTGTTGSATVRAGKGLMGEGIQEILQSPQEQMWQNLATGRPLSEGVAEAAAQGMVLGGVIGAAVNVAAGAPKETAPQVTDSNENLADKVDSRLAEIDPEKPAAPAQPMPTTQMDMFGGPAVQATESTPVRDAPAAPAAEQFDTSNPDKITVAHQQGLDLEGGGVRGTAAQSQMNTVEGVDNLISHYSSSVPDSDPHKSGMLTYLKARRVELVKAERSAFNPAAGNADPTALPAGRKLQDGDLKASGVPARVLKSIVGLDIRNDFAKIESTLAEAASSAKSERQAGIILRTLERLRGVKAGLDQQVMAQVDTRINSLPSPAPSLSNLSKQEQALQQRRAEDTRAPQGQALAAYRLQADEIRRKEDELAHLNQKIEGNNRAKVLHSILSNPDITNKLRAFKKRTGGMLPTAEEQRIIDAHAAIAEARSKHIAPTLTTLQAKEQAVNESVEAHRQAEQQPGFQRDLFQQGETVQGTQTDRTPAETLGTHNMPTQKEYEARSRELGDMFDAALSAGDTARAQDIVAMANEELGPYYAELMAKGPTAKMIDSNGRVTQAAKAKKGAPNEGTVQTEPTAQDVPRTEPKVKPAKTGGETSVAATTTKEGEVNGKPTTTVSQEVQGASKTEERESTSTVPTQESLLEEKKAPLKEWPFPKPKEAPPAPEKKTQATEKAKRVKATPAQEKLMAEISSEMETFHEALTEAQNEVARYRSELEAAEAIDDESSWARVSRRNLAAAKATLDKLVRSAVAPESINPADITKPTSKGRIVIALNSLLPNWQGKVKIFNTASEVPAEMQQYFTNPRTAARYIPADGKGGGGFAIMVADRIQQNSEKGVFLHEIGVHAGLPSAVIKRLANDIRAWAKDENRGVLEQMWSNRVVAEVEKNNLDRIARGEPTMTDELRAHEEVALFVQRLSENGIDPVQPEGVSAGLAAWLKDLVAQFRSMLSKALNTSVKLSGQDIVTLANAAAANVSRQEVMGNKLEAFNGEAPASTISSPSKTEMDFIEKGVSGKSLIAAADWVAANASGDPTYREIALRVGSRLRKMRDAGVKIGNINVVGIGDTVPISISRNPSALGWADSPVGGLHQIGIVGQNIKGRQSGLSFETLLHELTHTALAGTIHLGAYPTLADGTQTRVHTRKMLDLYSAVVSEASKRIKESKAGTRELTPFEESILKGANSLKDVHEMVSWGLTNAEFQKWLESVPYKGSYSMWNKFTEIVRGILGLPARADTALSELLQASSNLLSAPVSELAHIAKAGGRSISSDAIHLQTAAAVENPDSPVSKTLAKNIKELLVNAKTRKSALGWMSMQALVDMYAPKKSTGWRGALRKLHAKMTEQDGFMNSLKVKSNLIAGQFNEFEASSEKYSEFYTFMLHTTETGVDPRLKLSDVAGELLLPIEQQAAYMKAKAGVEEAKAKVAKFGPEAEQHTTNLKEAEALLAAVKQDYAGVLGKYNKMNPEEKEAFLKTYREAEETWKRWGNVAGAKNPKIAHELYNSTERHLKSLGQQQIDTLITSWYDISYSPDFKYPDGTKIDGVDVSGQQVPRATSVSEMRKQMRAGYAGTAAQEFIDKKVDPTLERMHQGPYFHMARWGDYWVSYKSGNEMHREHFETKAEWDEVVAHVRSLEKEGKVEKVDAGVKADETTRAMSTPMLKNMITAAEAQINAQVGVSEETKATQVKLMRDTLARAYIDTLPETSSKTMQQLRRNVKGASNDMKRSFAKRAEAAHINIAMAKHMPQINILTREMELAAKDLGKEGASTDEIDVARNVVDEVKKRQNDLSNQPEKSWRDSLMSLNHFWYLAGNIKYNVANLMQPMQFVGVIGGKFGMVNAGRALSKAYPGAVAIFNEARKVSWSNPHLDFSKHLADAEAGQTPLNLNLGQWRMLDALNKQGKLDFTLARELGAISNQEAFDEESKFGKVGNTANRWGKVLSVAGHHSETINRSATALAAYNLFMERNAKMEDKVKLQKEASEYAQHAVDKTHFDYSGINTARQMGRNGILGKSTPLVMAFKRFQAQQIELYLDTIRRSIGADRARRLSDLKASLKEQPQSKIDEEVAAFNKNEDLFEAEAKVQLRGMLGMTLVLAGAMGLPAATVIAAALNALGDDDEDIRNKWRKWAADYFGKFGGGVVTNGVFHGLGADMQGSIGAQDIIPFSRFLADRREFKDKVQSLVSDSSGAAVGMLTHMVAAGGMVYDGEINKALVEALPKAVSNILKGAKLGSDGFYRDAKGNKLPGDTDAIEAVLVMMGFTPSKIEERGAANRYLKSKQYLQSKETAKIHDAYNKARDEKDETGVREAMQALKDYNTEHPDARVPMQSLPKSYIAERKKQIVAERTGTGILTSARKAKEAKDDAGWVNWGNE